MGTVKRGYLLGLRGYLGQNLKWEYFKLRLPTPNSLVYGKLFVLKNLGLPVLKLKDGSDK